MAWRVRFEVWRGCESSVVYSDSSSSVVTSDVAMSTGSLPLILEHELLFPSSPSARSHATLALTAADDYSRLLDWLMNSFTTASEHLCSVELGTAVLSGMSPAGLRDQWATVLGWDLLTVRLSRPSTQRDSLLQSCSWRAVPQCGTPAAIPHTGSSRLCLIEIVCLLVQTASGVNSSPSRCWSPQSSCLKFFVRHSPPVLTRFSCSDKIFLFCDRLTGVQPIRTTTSCVELRILKHLLDRTVSSRFTFMHCVRFALTQQLGVGTAIVLRLRTHAVADERVLLRIVSTLHPLGIGVPLSDDVGQLAAQVVVLHHAGNLVDLRLVHCSIQLRFHLSCVSLVPHTALCCFSSRGPLVALPVFTPPVAAIRTSRSSHSAVINSSVRRDFSRVRSCTSAVLISCPSCHRCRVCS